MTSNNQFLIYKKTHQEKFPRKNPCQLKNLSVMQFQGQYTYYCNQYTVPRILIQRVCKLKSNTYYDAKTIAIDSIYISEVS